ncbi:hypothetical protein GCM10022234_05020 [Aeromicrobium panaciterrae]|uniref:DUF7064 domain-containing protein n=1 Tax=Aeromicrobium panaciterrae TaxID=363861 RepID=UPI0031DD0D69
MPVQQEVETYRLDVHEVEPDAPGMTYQENMLFSWYDLDKGVAGSASVRAELNNSVTIWSGVASENGLRYRLNRAGVPNEPHNHTPERHGGGPIAFTGGDTFGFEHHDDDVDIALKLHEFYPPLEPWGDDQIDQVQAAAGHLETSGRVTGTVRVGDETFEIDGLGYRDHSWAQANMALVRSHAWVAGTFGPDLSFSGIVYQGIGGAYMRGASIVRDGVKILADKVDIIIHQECDGISNRGGEMTLYLPNDEKITIVAEAFDGFVFEMGPMAIAESMCRARIKGTNRVGQCNFEGGPAHERTRAITDAFNAVAIDGISRRP